MCVWGGGGGGAETIILFLTYTYCLIPQNLPIILKRAIIPLSCFIMFKTFDEIA